MTKALAVQYLLSFFRLLEGMHRRKHKSKMKINKESCAHLQKFHWHRKRNGWAIFSNSMWRDFDPYGRYDDSFTERFLSSLYCNEALKFMSHTLRMFLLAAISIITMVCPDCSNPLVEVFKWINLFIRRFLNALVRHELIAGWSFFLRSRARRSFELRLVFYESETLSGQKLRLRATLNHLWNLTEIFISAKRVRERRKWYQVKIHFVMLQRVASNIDDL